MAITVAMIKELRKLTGAGMMDCKKALTEANGDMELAIENLRKKGAATAEKKAGRIAAEGIISFARNDTASVLVEINCETDFVAKDDSFRDFSSSTAETILNNSPIDIEGLSSCKFENGESVEASQQELITKIGENISVRRFARIEPEDGIVSCYLHGTRIGVLVKFRGGTDELGRDLAMHIAASRPMCISEDEMDSSILEKEKEIFIAQAAESGKPPEIIDKMVGGRIKKFLKENTLLDQPFVKDRDMTVGELVKKSEAEVIQMIRLEVGEGLEKRSEDFVAEVMAQAGS